MNTPEYDQKIYPISAVMNGNASLDGPTYDIIDMRSQQVIIATQNTYKQLLPVLHKLNTDLEAGVYDGDKTGIADDALLLVLELNTPAPVADAVAAEAVPQVEQVSLRTQQVRAPQSLAFVAPLEPLEKL